MATVQLQVVGLCSRSNQSNRETGISQISDVARHESEMELIGNASAPLIR